MNKNSKRILIRRKVREVIEVKQAGKIILFCENCQNEQIFRLKESAGLIEKNKESEKKESYEK
jgi:hypothetical protein